MRKRLIPLLTLLLLIPCVSFAMLVFDPSNYAKNVIIARNSLMSLVNQARQIQHQIQSLKFEWQNLKHLDHVEWRALNGLLQKMDAMTKQGDALSYAMSDLDKQFNAKYPNYMGSSAPMHYRMAVTVWDKTTLATLSCYKHTLRKTNAPFVSL